ncbi:hypothetical protein F5Y18DRAFT_104081 [Xylariaceae sp. FL1019]|nr:hypothetical protein F5Y18DRAFT_104081 [Xylariaceae sp. FL1019]
MAGPASPNEGPTFEPPHLPPGWIAQWDGASRKYYYVQLSTGVSQWEIPTDAAPGGTPAQHAEHPYGVPGRHELITHPDGTQTIKHEDGRMEPIMPPDSSRGMGGPTGERGFGSMAANALLSQVSGGHGKAHGSSGSSNGLGSLAGQLIGGLAGGHGNSHSSSSGNHSSGGGAGAIVGQLASNLFSSGHKPEQPTNYHGGQSQQSHHSGGLAGQVMGGVTGMFGGSNHGQSGQHYGYSNSGGQSSGYSGQAPPTSYQSPSVPASSYTSPPSNQHSAPSYNPPHPQQGTPAYPQGAGHPSAHHDSPYGGASPSGSSSTYNHSPAPQQSTYLPHQNQYTSSGPGQSSYGGQNWPPPPSNYNQQYQTPPPPVGAPQHYPGHPTYSDHAPPHPTGPYATQAPHGQPHGGGYPGKY